MQSKIEILLEFKENIKAGIDGANSKLDSFKSKNLDAFDAIESKVPGVSSLVSSLANPYVLVTGAVAGLGAGAIALGNHLMDVSEDIRLHTNDVKTYFNVTGKEADETTAKIMALAHVFDEVDETELTRSAAAFQKVFKDTLDPSQSVDLVEKAMLATNGKLDLEEIREYSSQLKSLGFTAEESLGVIVDGFQKSIYNDKAPDALKEAGLSLREMTKTQQEALIGLKIDPKQISKGFDDGSLTAIAAIKQVSAAMADADTVAQQTAIADIFKGAGEDAGLDYLLSLKDANFELDSMIKLNDPLIEKKMKLLELEEDTVKAQQRFAPAFNQMSDKFTELTAEAKLLFYDVMADGVDYIMDAWNDPEFFSADPFAQIIGKLSVAWDWLVMIYDLNMEWFGLLWDIGTTVYDLIVGAFETVGDALMEFNFISDFFDGAEDRFDIIKLQLYDLLESFKLAWRSFRAIFNEEDAGDLLRQSKEKLLSIGTKDYTLELKKIRLLEANTAVDQEGITNAGDSAKETTKKLSRAKETVDSVEGAAAQVKNITFNIEALMKGDIIMKALAEKGMSLNELKGLFSEMLLQEVRDVERSL